MARYDLRIGGNFIPPEKAIWPKRFRVGYRGPGPGMREVGMISMRLKDLDGEYRDGPAKIEIGQEMLISRADEKIFRGLISRIVKDRKHPWLDLEAQEQAAVLKEYKGGMRIIGENIGIPNPSLFIWVREEELTDAETGEKYRALKAITNEVYEEMSLPNQVTYEKMWLFTSYHWLTDFSMYHAFKMHMAEPKTVEQILGEICQQSILQTGQIIHIGNVEIEGPIWEQQIHVEEVGGEELAVREKCGLVQQGYHLFVYWYEADYIVNIAQIINRSYAIILARFPVLSEPPPLDGGFAMDVFCDEPLLVKNTRDPNLLAFYVMYGRWSENLQELHQCLCVAYIELRDTNSTETEQMIPAQYERHWYTFPNDDRRWEGVWATSENRWGVYLNRFPQLERNLTIEDGWYSLAYMWADPEKFMGLSYKGTLLLKEMIFDFENRSLATILSDVAYVTGCDWWIDGDRRLHMRRIDCVAETAIVSGKILEEQEIEELVQDEEFERSISGIPISDTHAKLLKEYWGEVKRGQNGRKKQLIMDIPNAIGVQLGQNVQAAGRAHGKLEAMEFEGDKVTLETAL